MKTLLRIEPAQTSPLFRAGANPFLPQIGKSLTATLTTEHAASSYGLPVLVIAGTAYGPADVGKIHISPEGGGEWEPGAREELIQWAGAFAAQNSAYGDRVSGAISFSGVDASTSFREFLQGFAKALNCDTNEAREQWAGFSRQLSDSARQIEEMQGEDRGFELGTQCKALEN